MSEMKRFSATIDNKVIHGNTIAPIKRWATIQSNKGKYKQDFIEIYDNQKEKILNFAKTSNNEWYYV